jgi:hypothetical protein
MSQLTPAGLVLACAALAGGCRTAGPAEQATTAGIASTSASRVDARWIMPSTDTMVMSRAGEAQPVAMGAPPARVVIGATIETVERVKDAAGHSVFDVTFEEHDDTGVVARTITRVDGTSLLPVRQRAELGGGHVVTLHYMLNHVIGIDSAADHSVSLFSTPIADSVYSSGAIDLVLRALPLGERYRGSVPIYFPADNLIQSLPVRVTSQERIITRSGRAVLCWLVAADFPGGITEHFWIDQTTHGIVRILAHDSETSLVRYDR